MQEITVEWECAGCRAKNVAELAHVIALWGSTQRGNRGTKVFLRCEGCEQETFVCFVGRPPHTASPAQIDAYLVSRGWRKRESKDQRWAEYARHTRHHMIQTIVVPQMHDASDYLRAVDFMLYDLAWIEGRVVDEIVRDIRAAKAGSP